MANQSSRPSRPVSEYFYLDEPGIDSLFAQTTDRLETEHMTTTEKGRERSASGKAGLRVLFGGAEASAAASRSGKDGQQVTSKLTTENKLERLLIYLGQFERSRVFESIDAAALASEQTNTTVFLSVQRGFDVPQFADEHDGVARVNEDHAVMFEINGPSSRSYIYNDDYFHETRYGPGPYGRGPYVTMIASLAKLKRTGDQMHRASHDAILLRKGSDVQLGVFGSLSCITSGVFQIKPYGIWLPR